MGTKTVSLRISEKLFNELHEQSAKQSVTITKLFWAMCNNPNIRDAEIYNLEHGNPDNSNGNDIKPEMNVDIEPAINTEIEPEMKVEDAKNNRNRYIYIETNKEKNNIIKWLSQNGIFLDDNSRIDWVYNNNKKTKIIVNGKIILNKIFPDKYVN